MKNKISGKYKSILRFPPTFKYYTKEGLIELKRELSLAILEGEDITDLERKVSDYEFRLNRPGTGDAGPR